jgi:hypothetical protein
MNRPWTIKGSYGFPEELFAFEHPTQRPPK